MIAGFAAVAFSKAEGQATAPVLMPRTMGVVQYIASQPDPTGRLLYGINASLEVKSIHFYGIEIQGSGQHWGSYSTRYFGGIGPQFVFRSGPFRIHLAALEGGSRDRIYKSPGYTTDPQISFAVRGEGGLDVRSAHHWVFRLIDVTETYSLPKPYAKTMGISQGIGFIF
jgi:hypothetical protein